jgi:hypothetical protein
MLRVVTCRKHHQWIWEIEAACLCLAQELPVLLASLEIAPSSILLAWCR